MSSSHASTALRGATKIVIGSYIANLLTIAAGILIPRFLGKQAYGEYAFFSAAFSLATGISSLGLGLVITRYFAPLFESGEQEKAVGLYNAFFLCRVLSGLIISISSFIFLEFTNPFKSSFAALILMFFLVLIWNVSDTLFTLQLGAQRYGYWGLRLPLRPLARLSLVIPGFFVAGIPGAIGGLVFGEFLISLFGFHLRRQVLPRKIVKADFAALWAYRRLVGLNYVNQLLGIVGNYLGVMLVAFTTYSAETTGYYALATRLVMLLYSAPQQALGSMTPALAILHEQKEASRFSTWIDLGIRGGIFGFVIIWGVFGLAGKPVIALLLGESFKPVYIILLALLISLPFQWIGNAMFQVCIVHERPELNIPSGLIWLICFGIFGLWFLDLWGPTGLAAAYTIATIISVTAAYLIVRFYLHIRIALMRCAILLFCALPFVAAMMLGENILERIAGAFIGIAAAAIIAHVTGALRIDEIAAFYRRLKGGGNSGNSEDN